MTRYACLAALTLLAGCDPTSSTEPPGPTPDPAPVYDDTPVAFNAAVHDTGAVRLRLFNTGLQGGAVGLSGADAFSLDGQNGLYEGHLLVGQSPTQVSGQPYTGATEGDPTEWSFGSGLLAVAPPAGYDQAFRTRFTDAGVANPRPLGLRLTQWSYSSRSAAAARFVVLAYDIEATAADRPGVYVGLFADFDVGPAAANRSGYDAATQTVYTYDPSGANPVYYGVSALTGTVSGWRESIAYTAPPVPEATLFEALTTPGEPAAADGDRRAVIGVGPLTLVAGRPQRVAFAYVAGGSLPDLLAAAATARQRVPAAPAR